VHRNRLLRGLATAGVVVALTAACGGEPSGDPAERGAALFRGEGTCATCHGASLEGTPMGPSFLDPIYAPGHHPDAAFHAAVRNGVQPHHWAFGPMPALPHLDDGDVDDIIAFVRKEQRAAGVD
jgi:mono/diheme cytochrome c family protein